MKPLVILATASRALADSWSATLDLQEPVRFADPARLAALDHPAGSLVLWDLPPPPLPAEPDLIKICQHYRVLALSSRPSDDEGMLWLQRGAVGYAHAMSAPDLLRQVYETLNAGGIWVGREIMQQLCVRFGQLVPPATPDQTWVNKLSGREVEVVEALRLGLANKEIARKLDITERTVKAHLTSVFQKFEVEDRLQLLIRLTDGKVGDHGA
jgi:DNA-binding NarL/FixJ family response regulator